MILKKSKIQIKVMVQLVTGHANLKRHRYLKLENSPQCDCGEDEETSIHLLTSCPLQTKNRWHSLGKATLRSSRYSRHAYKQDNEIFQSHKQMVRRSLRHKTTSHNLSQGI